MEIFGLHDRLIQDYADYIQRLILIRDPQVHGYAGPKLGKRRSA
jgi:hypothetical protein